MVLHEIHDFLGERRRIAVLELLGSPSLAWERSDRLGRTTSGRMWQLASSAMHHTPEMIQLSEIMASLVYGAVCRCMSGVLPDAANVVSQVFPVRMEGNDTEPPTQWKHKDEARGKNPITTSLYYALVKDTAGGALALHDDAGEILTRVYPNSDQLVVMPGSQIHSVDPLTAGDRITVVTNFY